MLLLSYFLCGRRVERVSVVDRREVDLRGCPFDPPLSKHTIPRLSLASETILREGVPHLDYEGASSQK